MKPYYEAGGVVLYHGDSREVLPTLEPASVDLIVTDPPYGTASPSKVQKRGANTLTMFNIAWDADLPLDWIAPAVRLLKPGGAFLAFTDNLSVKAVWNACQVAGLHPLQTVYWRKTNPPPQPRKNFCSAIETAVFARKPGKVLCWNGGGATPNVLDEPIVGGNEREDHPTQKPERLLRWLISVLSDAGDVVLDPFMGSGTTMRAAKDMGRQAIGCELDERYCEIAARRLSQQVLPLEVPA